MRAEVVATTVASSGASLGSDVPQSRHTSLQRALAAADNTLSLDDLSLEGLNLAGRALLALSETALALDNSALGFASFTADLTDDQSSSATLANSPQTLDTSRNLTKHLLRGGLAGLSSQDTAFAASSATLLTQALVLLERTDSSLVSASTGLAGATHELSLHALEHNLAVSSLDLAARASHLAETLSLHLLAVAASASAGSLGNAQNLLLALQNSLLHLDSQPASAKLASNLADTLLALLCGSLQCTLQRSLLDNGSLDGAALSGALAD
jgi:hypothetical protein